MSKKTKKTKLTQTALFKAEHNSRALTLTLTYQQAEQLRYAALSALKTLHASSYSSREVYIARLSRIVMQLETAMEDRNQRDADRELALLRAQRD